MSDRYKQILQKVFENLPAQDRLLFLEEVIASLSKEDRKELSLRVSKRKSAMPVPSPIPEPVPFAEISPVVEAVASPEKKPEKVEPEPIAEVSPVVKEVVRPEKKPEKVEQEPVPARRRIPRPNEEPKSAQPEKPLDKKALVDAEFKKFVAQTDRTTSQSMKRQLVSCLGLGLLGVGAIVALAVVGRTVFDWLMGMAS